MTDVTPQADTRKSQAAYRAARAVMPGGINSPAQVFPTSESEPRFMAKGAGAILTDIDGNETIDYVCSWGGMILGHADDRVEAAVNKAAAKGASLGGPTEAEVRLAEMVVARVPGIELVRFVASQAEATMSVVRLARAFTGRNVIVRFDGCNHGAVDALLVEAGSGGSSLGAPSSPGVPEGTTADTFCAPYNDVEGVERLFAEHGRAIAGVVVEPIASHMGCVPPNDGYLARLRALCDEHGTLLILDERTTGFRVAPGGAQELYAVRPDLTCLGPILGGGLPLAAFGGRTEIMERVSPAGPVVPSGLPSGHSLATAAGLATLEALAEDGVYETLEARSTRLADGLTEVARQAGATVCHNRVGSMLSLFFADGPVTDLASAARSDARRYAAFFHALLERGVSLPPSPFGCLFVSLAHTEALIERTIAAAADAFARAAGAEPNFERTPT